MGLLSMIFVTRFEETISSFEDSRQAKSVKKIGWFYDWLTHWLTDWHNHLETGHMNKNSIVKINKKTSVNKSAHKMIILSE